MPIYIDHNMEECYWISIYNEFPVHFRGLHFVGLSGFATASQLSEWIMIYEPDEDECYQTISKLINNGFINKLSPMQLRKKNFDEGNVIFYPTEEGFNEIKRLSDNPKFAEYPAQKIREQFLFGKPIGQKLDRVFHQLMLSASILKILEENEFVWYMSENQLKKEDFRDRAQKNDVTGLLRFRLQLDLETTEFII